MPEVKLSEISALTPISSASKLYGITGTAYGYVTIDDIHQLLPEHALLTGLPSTLIGYNDGGVATAIALSDDLNITVLSKLEIADNAVSLDKQAHGTANRLQGFDGGGVPSEITVSSLLTLSSGELTVADNAVGLDKQAHGTANRLQGFDGTGVPSEITVASPLTLSGGELSVSGSETDWQKLARYHRFHLRATAFSTGSTGTGTTGSLSDRRGIVSTGATANSTAILYFHAQEQLGWSAGKDYRVLDWSKALGFSIMITQTVRAANGKGRIYWGADDATTAADPTTKAIGFCIDNGDVKGWCHDGTTLTTVNLSVTLTLTETAYLTVVSDGAGNIEWFVNGVSKGTSTLGPTGDSSSTMNSFQFSIANGASASDCDLWLHSLEGVIEL